MVKIHQEAIDSFHTECELLVHKLCPLHQKRCIIIIIFKGESLCSIPPHYDYNEYTIISILNSERGVKPALQRRHSDEGESLQILFDRKCI